MTRREIPLDATTILRVLSKNSVDYVVIGGVAVQAHGHTRTTQDLDIFPEPSRGNLRRLERALAELQARPLGRAPHGPENLEPADQGVQELDTDAGGIDIHFHPPGAASYEDVRERALELQVAGVELAVAGRDDLIAMKRASGRPIDRGDIIALTEMEA
jgi:hypothetical protein